MHPKYSKAQSLTGAIIGAAIEVHRHLGPGLIESIYERCLCHELELRGLRYERQRVIKIEFKGLVFEEVLRCDILVDGCVLVENKCVESVIRGDPGNLHETARCAAGPALQLSRAGFERTELSAESFPEPIVPECISVPSASLVPNSESSFVS